MRKQKITRLLCFALAMLFLVSTAVVAVSADASFNGVTDKTIEDYMDELSTGSYEEYMETHAAYFLDYANATTKTVTFDATTDLVFTDKSGNTIEIKDGKWKMTVGDGADAIVYNSVEEAVADEKTNFAKEDLVDIVEYDGKQAIYTPAVGSVTWTLDLQAMEIDEAGLYSIDLEYYPIVGKSSSGERKFSINGVTPFSEARSLKFAKIWSSFKTDGKSGLVAAYRVGKNQNVADVVAAGTEAGLACKASEDGSVVYFEKPEVITEAIDAFISEYKLRFFIVDSDNNELRPTMVQTPEWTVYSLRDGEGYYANDFGFLLNPNDNGGKVDFTLEAVNECIAISTITIRPYTETISYKEYMNTLKNNVGSNGQVPLGTGKVKIESEYPFHTSTNVVYPIEDRTSSATSPCDPGRVLLNTIGTEKWATAGQWVEYKFEVSGSGLYDIFTRYKQSYLDGMYVCRVLNIYTNYASAEEYQAKFGNTAGYYNGVPFAEAAQLRYDYGTSWQVTNLTSGVDADGDGEDDTYQIYFREGVEYTIRLEVTLGSMSDMVRQIEAILNSLNQDYLNIIKLTGTDPDEYTDYKFTRVLPDTLIDMMIQSEGLRDISAFLKETAEVASTYSGTCDKLEQLLVKMAKDEAQIAKNLDNFKSYVGNLGTFLSDAKTQPLQMDYISIQPAGEKAPRADGNFFQNFAHEFNCFIQSFFRDYNNMGAMDDLEANASVAVWLAYGRDQSQVIRNLTTNEFTPDTGIAVDLKLVSGGTLLPSILAGRGPDVYLGLADATVINYAIRGALTNVEDREGFDQIVDECFTRAAMLQLEIADSDGVVHTYGLPETQTFNMMFVRLDVLAENGIEIPTTWDDLMVAQSKLESNNMEIGLTTNYKVFLYQSNGSLYADDGMRINLDSVKGLAAFEKMCNLFTQYSFPYTYSAANRFRSGEYPIIIADYTGLYNQLKVFATEIEGSWTFVPIPGTLQADGSINNTADSTIAAVVMISDIKDPDSAWNFMKWYTGAEAQTRYANEMVAIIGDSAKHPTANRVALMEMPWTRDEFIEVSKQFENLAAIPNYPGSYYLDRHTSFAFLAAYNDDADPSTELLSYINTINNEITRKRLEFKLEVLEIGQTLASKRSDQALEAMEVLTEKFGNSKNAAVYEKAITAAKYAIANEKVKQLDEASGMFTALLEYDFTPDLNAIQADPDLTNVEKTSQTKRVIDKVKTYSYFINVGKQTAERENGGYAINSLTEEQLVYFIGECLRNIADSITEYNQ